MTRDEFSRIAENFLYLDGATGSNLVKAGMPAGVCPEKWILEHPEVMLRISFENLCALAAIPARIFSTLVSTFLEYV